MKSEIIYSAIGAADDELLLCCESPKKRPLNPWVKYGSLAACLCLIILGAYALFSKPAAPEPSGKPVLQWSAAFAASDYFKYSDSAEDGGISSSSDMSRAFLPWAFSRSFSDTREALEAEGVIPVMGDHPQFYCEANYNEDGSIYSLVISWHARGDSLSDYSDLKVTAGYQEIEQIQDCISIELDENGNIIAPAVTVTQRDGILIVAEGYEYGKKTVTFQNQYGWYQIEGSFNDGYAPMVSLLDWFWERPIDFGRFPAEAGDSFTGAMLDERPYAFAGYIPDFAAYGFVAEQEYLGLKNNEPYFFEGHYVANAPEELVKASSYYDVEGWTYIWWCIKSAPDYYDRRKSLGELDELSEQIILGVTENSGYFGFFMNDYYIEGYTNTPQELWAILQKLP